MTLALTYVASSVVILVCLTVVYVIEDIKGRRIFLTQARTWLDSLFERLLRKGSSVMFSFSNGFMRLLFHYGAHSILKRILLAVRKLEKKVEDLVRRNRRVAKDISANKQKNHLDAIAEHKEEVALNETQKEEMRSH